MVNNKKSQQCKEEVTNKMKSFENIKDMIIAIILDKPYFHIIEEKYKSPEKEAIIEAMKELETKAKSKTKEEQINVLIDMARDYQLDYIFSIIGSII